MDTSLVPSPSECVSGSSLSPPDSSAPSEPLRRRSLEPRHELDEREWLREVVVAARVEAGDAVDDRVTGGQEEHRRPHASRAERLAQVAPVRVRQADVDHEHVRDRAFHRLERIRPRRGGVDREALLAEPAPEHAAQLLVVLDEQNGSP
jgi:hypothetical protein